MILSLPLSFSCSLLKHAEYTLRDGVPKKLEIDRILQKLKSSERDIVTAKQADITPSGTYI